MDKAINPKHSKLNIVIMNVKNIILSCFIGSLNDLIKLVSLYSFIRYSNLQISHFIGLKNLLFVGSIKLLSISF